MIFELKKIGKHSLIYGTGILLSKSIGFFMIPLYTRYLTPKDYGVMEMLDLLGYFLAFLLGLGIDQGMVKYFYFYSEKKDKDAVISTAIIFNLICGLGVILIFLSFNKILSFIILGSNQYAFLLIISFINLYIGCNLGLARTVIRSQQKSIFFVTISLISTVCTILLNIYFLTIEKIGIKGILFSTLITSFFILSYLYVNILRQTGKHFHISKLKEMLTYGLPFVPASIFAYFLNWSDRYFLRIYSDIDTVGIYALGYKMGMIIVVMIATPFTFIWNAYFFEIEKQSNAKEVYARIATYFLLALGSLGIIISIFSRELIVTMADPSYLNAYKVIPLIVLSMVFMCSDNVFQVGLLIKGKSKYLPLAKGFAAIVNLVLNFLLIPKYNMYGAAISTAISFFVYSAAILYAGQKHYFINFEFLRLIKIGSAAVIVFAVSSFVTMDKLWLSVVIKLSILCLFPFLLFLFKFPTKEENGYLGDLFEMIRSFLLRRYKKA